MIQAGDRERAGLIGAFTAVILGGIGSYFGGLAQAAGGALTAAQRVTQTLAHGLVGGIASAARGGKFIAGFLSAGSTQAFAGSIGGLDAGIGGLDAGNSGVSLSRTAAAATLGGTASVLGGGKFANGAATGAFAYTFGSIARQALGPPGRALTVDEMIIAKEVFGDGINYSQVRIINGNFVPFQTVPMSPDGNIYWRDDCSNFATCYGGKYAKNFIHEMTHVLQVQHGVNVLGQGFLLQTGRFLSFGTYDPYKLTYDPNRAFSSYNIEQQGSIAAKIYGGQLPNNIDY